ncbi:hypothetical protein D3C83_20720 [compost metagenome]
MEAVQVMAGIEHDERIVDLFRGDLGLMNPDCGAELFHQVHQARALALDRLRVVHHDQQPVCAARKQELAQGIIAPGRIPFARQAVVENTDDALGLRDQTVYDRLVLAHALEAPVLGVRQIAGQRRRGHFVLVNSHHSTASSGMSSRPRAR